MVRLQKVISGLNVIYIKPAFPQLIQLSTYQSPITTIVQHKDALTCILASSKETNH